MKNLCARCKSCRKILTTNEKLRESCPKRYPASKLVSRQLKAWEINTVNSKFTSQKLQMEKDQAISELNQLKDWAEALKARHDIVEKNKQLCEENYDNVVVDCSQFRKQIQELQFQLSVSRRQELNVKEENDELIREVRKKPGANEISTVKREKKAINERDEARKERDEMYQQFIDVQNEKRQCSGEIPPGDQRGLSADTK